MAGVRRWRCLRRHRLIELFLVEVLDLDWVHVHDEAEVLEHAFSDRILARIDEILGHPVSDPHGDPIPRTDGSIPEILDRPLSELESGGKLPGDQGGPSRSGIPGVPG
jgi:DtxR family Mn-dependent transcriptional regulator